MIHRAKAALISVAIIVVTVLTISPLTAAEPIFVDGIVAIVGNDIITASELEEAEVSLKDDPTFKIEGDRPLKQQVLDRMIEDHLINQAAARESLTATTEEVDQAIEGWLRQNQISKDMLQSELKRAGITWEDYHANMRKNLIQSRFIDYMISPKVGVTDAQIRAYYAREVSNVKAEDKADIWLIFLPFPEGADTAQREAIVLEAAALRAQILGGELSFEDAAQSHSAHPSSAEGGYLGQFGKGQLFPALDEVVFSMVSPDAISEPLTTDNGIFLARSKVSQVADTVTLKEARPQIEALLYQQELERQLGLWVEEARRQAHIEILVPVDSL